MSCGRLSSPDRALGSGGARCRGGCVLRCTRCWRGIRWIGRGRCRSCRRPGAVLGGARRRCQIRVTACYWLHQPDETLLLDLLARELNQHPRPSPGPGERTDRSGSGHLVPAAGPGTTDVLPRIDLDQEDPPPQTPTVPRPPPPGGGCPPAERSAPAHDRAGTHRARPSPPDEPPAQPLRHHNADPEQQLPRSTTTVGPGRLVGARSVAVTPVATGRRLERGNSPVNTKKASRSTGTGAPRRIGKDCDD